MGPACPLLCMARKPCLVRRKEPIPRLAAGGVRPPYQIGGPPPFTGEVGLIANDDGPRYSRTVSAEILPAQANCSAPLRWLERRLRLMDVFEPVAVQAENAVLVNVRGRFARLYELMVGFPVNRRSAVRAAIAACLETPGPKT